MLNRKQQLLHPAEVQQKRLNTSDPVSSDDDSSVSSLKMKIFTVFMCLIFRAEESVTSAQHRPAVLHRDLERSVIPLHPCESSRTEAETRRDPGAVGL